jgi:uncharacterized protein YukE
MKNNPLRHSLDLNRFSRLQDTPNLKGLKLQVNELQTVNQNYRERNKMLERQIEELNSEINNLLKLNRKLASSYGNVQLQELEQVCEGIYKKQMNDSFTTIDHLKQDLDRFKQIVQMLREENTHLKTKLFHYRSYVVQLSSSQEIPIFTSPTVEIWKDSIDSLPSLSKSKSVSEAFDNFSTVLKPLSQKSLFFINSPSLLKLYNSTLSSPKDRTKVGRLSLLIHGDLSTEKAFFSSKEEVQQACYSKDFLVFPITLQKDLDLIVQCSQPSRGCFEEADLKILSLFTSFLSKTLKLLQSKSQEKLRKNNMQKMIQLVATLVTARSLDTFANLLDEHLSSIFEFQEAGIVFVDHKVNQFFVYGYSPKANVKYCNEVIRLPINMGFTGEVFKGDSIRVFENLKNKAGFNQDIDNTASTGDIKQCLMVKLPGPDGIFTGVLQLNNKVSGKITKNDLKIVQEFAPLLGNIIFGISHFEEAFDLTLRMKNSINFLQGK